MTFAAFLAVGCCAENGGEAPKPLAIDNALTAEEKAEGKFTPEIMWKMSRIGQQVLSEDGSKLIYTVTQYNLAENRGITRLWLRDMATAEECAITDYNSTNTAPQWLSENRIAFMSNRTGSMQAWAMDIDGQNLTQLTNIEGGIEGFGIAGDHAFYVQRVKVAPLKGSDKYADMDKSKVRLYDDLMVRHWDYWDDGSYLHIFAADYKDGKIVDGVDIIGADKAYDAPLAPYFDTAEIRLSPDASMLAYTCKPLTGVDYALSTDSDIFLYDFATKATRNLSKEAAAQGDEKFVGYDKYPVFSPDGTKVAFRSQRRPGNEADQQRLWVFDLATNECTYITRGQDYCVTEVAWDGNEAMYFVLPWRGTHQVAHIDLAGNMKHITKGNHDINNFTFAGGKIVANMNTISKAVELYDVNLESGELTQLTDVNREIYDNIDFGKVEERWITTTDGKKMLTWVIYPPHFDPAKKYPVLLTQYSGPGSQEIENRYTTDWEETLARNGYIVACCDARGTGYRGEEFKKVTYGNLGFCEVEDQLSFAKHLAAQSFVDAGRLGIYGWSYGGFMALGCALKGDGLFKMAIAVAPVTSWRYYDSIYTEIYNGLPQDNPAGYDNNSPINFADRLSLNTRLLIIHGTADDNVHFQNAMEMCRALNDAGKQYDMMVYPDQNHSMRPTGMIHIRQKMVDYCLENL